MHNLSFIPDAGFCANTGNTLVTVEDCQQQGVLVSSTFILQGYYQESNGCMMQKSLNNAGLIPLSQPYNLAPHNYLGSESVTAIPTDAVDWILVQLRSASDRNLVMAQKAGFVSCTGELMALDGSIGVYFDSIMPSDYYITIIHRNHLAVMSNAPVSLPNADPYDFTIAPTQAYGIQQLYQVGSHYALIGGDYNGNGVINSLDYNLWISNNSLVNQYINWDGNGSGVVNNLDYNLWFANRSRLAVIELQF